MEGNKSAIAERAAQVSMSVLVDLLGGYPRPDFTVKFWEGTEWRTDPGVPSRFTLVLRHPGSLRRMLVPPTEVAMAEAYIYNDIDIEGDIYAAFSLAEYLGNLQWSLPEKVRLSLRLHALPANGGSRQGRGAAALQGGLHSIDRDRQANRFHYDTPNDFFALWLDKQLVYSCGYFKKLDDELDAAQEQKLEYVCRKLRLHKGEQLLDIGCGWGALVIHAARTYGAHCLGVTLSEQQAEYARARIRNEGLGGVCRVEVRDYREIDHPAGFDKLVSVGMFEHVGKALLPEYFNQAWRLLRPGGVFLNHGIARSPWEPRPAGPSFLDRYVFPDSETVPIETTLKIAGQAGFEVRDVESLREHYALTLRLWVERLEQNHDAASRITDETTYRIWRLFMAGSAYGFTRGKSNVYQTLLAKSDQGASGLPLTRADWYP